MTEPKPLDDRYWFIAGNEASPIDVPIPEFWSQLMSGDYRDGVVGKVAQADGWLVAAYEMTEDMQSSEMHPDGDELHYLASGRLGVVLEHDDGDEVLQLGAGSSAVVPRGVWHRFTVQEPARLVSMTFGRGTQHRELRS